MDNVFKSWRYQYEIFNGDEEKRKEGVKRMRYIKATRIFQNNLDVFAKRIESESDYITEINTHVLLRDTNVDNKLWEDYDNEVGRSNFETHNQWKKDLLSNMDDYTTYVDYDVLSQVYHDQKDRFTDGVSLHMKCRYDITDEELDEIKERSYYDVVTMEEYCIDHTPPSCSIFLSLDDVSPMKLTRIMCQPSGSVNFCPLEL